MNTFPDRPRHDIPPHLGLGAQLAVRARLLGLYAREFVVTSPLHLTAALTPDQYGAEYNQEIQMHMQRTYCAGQRIIARYAEQASSPYPHDDTGLPPQHL